LSSAKVQVEVEVERRGEERRGVFHDVFGRRS
jgi:hypothetical protein